MVLTGPEAKREQSGHDTPDSIKRIIIKTTAKETAPPFYKIKEEKCAAFSTPGDSSTEHPHQAVSEPTMTPGKPRRPRVSKVILIKTTGL